MKLKQLLPENKSIDALSKAVRYHMQSSLIDNEDIVRAAGVLRQANVTSAIIFQLAALFKRDTCKLNYFTNGAVEQQIKRVYFDGNDKQKALQQAAAIKQFVLAMNKYYEGSGWTALY